MGKRGLALLFVVVLGGCSSTAAPRDPGDEGLGEATSSEASPVAREGGAGPAMTQDRSVRSRGPRPRTSAHPGSESKPMQGVSGRILIGVPVPLTALDERARYKEVFRAAANVVTKEGGILGRDLQIVFWEFREEQFASFEERDEVWCEKFTQETPVFAAVVANGGTENLISCLASSDVIAFAGSTSQWADSTYRRYPGLVALSGLSLEQMAEAYADALLSQRFAGAGNKVGLITWDEPKYQRAVSQIIKPRFDDAGLTIVSYRSLEPPHSYGENARVIAEAEDTIIQWKQAGIDRVLLFTATRSEAIVFMNLAHLHDFHPAFGLVGGFSGADEAGGELASPSEQLRGSTGVGWTPAADIPWRSGIAMTPGAERCRSEMKNAGIEYENESDVYFSQYACDVVHFLKAALETAGSAPSFSSFTRGARIRGLNFLPAQTPQTQLSADRGSGASLYRPYRRSDSCGCFEYTGSWRSFQ